MASWSDRLRIAITALCVSLASCATVREVRLRPHSTCTPTEAATLTVKAVDQTGAYLPGARISLLDASGRPMERSTAGGDGIVILRTLPSDGTCRIRGELTGFETTMTTPFACPPGCLTIVSLPLRVDMRNAVTFM